MRSGSGPGCARTREGRPIARCGCAGQSCSCLIVEGEGINVSGSGTVDDPYVIESSASDIAGTIQFVDTDTVDFTVSGSGTEANPYQVRADATVALDDLTDVDAPAPAENEVLAWNGTAWVPAPPNTVDPGAISVAEPLTGDGTAASPLGLDLVTDESLHGTGTAADPLATATIVASGVDNAAAPPDVPGSSQTVVAFPAGRFPAAPAVTLNPRTALTTVRGMTATAVSATSFVANWGISSGSTSSVNFDWHAILDRTANPQVAAPSPRLGDLHTVIETGIVTCPTAGCENEGIGIEVPVVLSDPEAGENTTVDAYACGVCGTDITDTLVQTS